MKMSWVHESNKGPFGLAICKIRFLETAILKYVFNCN